MFVIDQGPDYETENLRVEVSDPLGPEVVLRPALAFPKVPGLRTKIDPLQGWSMGVSFQGRIADDYGD